MSTRMLASIVAAAGLLLLTGCSASTAGNASVAATAGEDLDLDTGSFPTSPQPEFSTVSNEAAGRYVEGQRMAEYIVLPTELDPLLTRSASMSTQVLKGPAALKVLLTGEVPAIAEREGMLMGFSTSRGYEDPDSSNAVVHAVFRFPDAESARRAAQEMSAEDLKAGEFRDAAVSAPIAGLPDTSVTSRSTDVKFSAHGFTPHQEYVIYTWASTKAETQDWAAQMIVGALALQGPLIDQFPTTPAGELGRLPMDIDDLLIYALPKPAANRTTRDQAVYGPRGAAHFSTNPALTMEYFEESNTLLMAGDGSTVYRSKDEAGAKRLFELFANEAVEFNGFTEAAPAPDVPNSTCFAATASSGRYTYCLVRNGRYLAEVSARDDETTAHQMAAAQYLILDSAR